VFPGGFAGCFLQIEFGRVAREHLPRGRKSKVKIREIPFWVFWVLSEESKAKKTEFYGQFLGTFQQTESQQM